MALVHPFIDFLKVEHACRWVWARKPARVKLLDVRQKFGFGEMKATRSLLGRHVARLNHEPDAICLDHCSPFYPPGRRHAASAVADSGALSFALAWLAPTRTGHGSTIRSSLALRRRGWKRA
jgi:hypothetical protein